uniref:Uncharacterized protein n=1 Tax=Oryza glumipatula TaxID=40148 RepID=A0A0D9YCE5_9ORYZ
MPRPSGEVLATACFVRVPVARTPPTPYAVVIDLHALAYSNGQRYSHPEMDKIVGGSTPSNTKSVVHPVVTPNSHPCAENRDASFNTPSNVHMCIGSHEDVSHLSVAELKRKRARDRYAALTPEQKDDRNKKARERRKRKKEETQVSESEASHLNITPRRLPFTIINNVAHYGPNEVPMSRFTQSTLNMNTSDFVVDNSGCENQYESSFFEGSDQNECDHDDDISLDFILRDQQNSP